MAQNDFNLFGPQKEAIGGKKNLEPTMKWNFLYNDGWTTNRKLFVKSDRTKATVYKGTWRICWKVGITLKKYD
jgi:hypothetical protein